VLVSWCFSVPARFSDAVRYLGAMFGVGGFSGRSILLAGELYHPGRMTEVALCAILAFGPIQAMDWVNRLTWLRSVALIVLFGVGLAAMFTQAFNPFLYSSSRSDENVTSGRGHRYLLTIGFLVIIAAVAPFQAADEIRQGDTPQASTCLPVFLQSPTSGRMRRTSRDNRWSRRPFAPQCSIFASWCSETRASRRWSADKGGGSTGPTSGFSLSDPPMILSTRRAGKRRARHRRFS